MKSSRSPLKQPPLHNPGESLLEKRYDLIGEQFLPYFAVAAAFILLSAYLWAIQLGWMKIQAPLFTFITAILVVLSFWKCKKTVKQVRLINRGLAAEKAVGQFLEQFRAQGYKVLHDIPVKTGEISFNIDHLLIGPKGIFTIETKSWRKPLKGQCIIVYDGQKVLVNGRAPTRDPIAQVLGQSAWLRDYLASCTALTSIPITPIVVYPGWFINYLQAGNAKVKVANEQLIWPCIQSTHHQLEPNDAKLIESRLTDYIQRHSS